MSQQIDEKNFSLTVTTVKAYQILTSLFTKTTLWFLTLSLSTVLSVTLSLISSVTSIITVSTVITPSVSLISRLLSSLSLVTTMSFSASTISKLLASISLSSVMSYIVSLISLITTTLTVTHSMAFVPVTGAFNLLDDYDAGDLDTIDLSTLGALDYTATP